MQKINVSLKRTVDNSYPILIAPGLLNKVPDILKKKPIGEHYAIICDSITARLFGRKLLGKFKAAKLDAILFTFPAGEQSKSLKVLEQLQNKMLEKGFNRKSAVVALGGGVTGDLAGFVAATYMRGIPYVQVPTTLLAMVDSSSGGKTAVDLPQGKNSCGAFHQPKAVFVDTACLKSLPQKQLSNGLAEIVKHAIIADARHFAFLEKNKGKIMVKNAKVLEKMVKRNCEIKARVVEKDPEEQNIRKIVNYGHTVGHALEVLGKYRKLSHGEAVAIGMAAEAAIAESLGFLSGNAVQRQNALLRAFNLPTALPNYPVGKIMAAMRRDKKSEKGKAMFVLPRAIGKMKSINGKYAINIDERIATKVLGQLQ